MKLLLSLSLLIGSSAGAFGQTTYSFQVLSNGQAFGINDRGQVLGIMPEADGIDISYLYSQENGSYQLFGLGDETASGYANGFNSLDQFIGPIELGSANNGRIFLYQNGLNQEGEGIGLNIGGIVDDEYPAAINDAGTLLVWDCQANQSCTSELAPIMTTWNFLAITYPGAASTYAASLNDANTVVGNYKDSQGHQHGFVYQAGSYSTLDVPHTKSTMLTGINNVGQIVGNYVGLKGVTRGFVYSAGTFTTINLPANLASYGTINLVGINVQGQLVGNAGKTPFIASPSTFAGF